ncbi:hypothetical protein SDC9_167133 [bioreactor metagenome]|uniref:Uncharacterized protein n=1 Tax=bioreactor metagenome TaxID=1076179 RepID=A0A645FYY8_9ZZZZ
MRVDHRDLEGHVFHVFPATTDLHVEMRRPFRPMYPQIDQCRIQALDERSGTFSRGLRLKLGHPRDFVQVATLTALEFMERSPPDHRQTNHNSQPESQTARLLAALRERGTHDRDIVRECLRTACRPPIENYLVPETVCRADYDQRTPACPASSAVQADVASVFAPRPEMAIRVGHAEKAGNALSRPGYRPSPSTGCGRAGSGHRHR